MPNSIQLQRVLKASPEKIYRAFLEPEAKSKWIPPFGFTAKIDDIEPNVGGAYKMSFTNFTTGTSHSFCGKYIELKPYTKIKYTDQFDDPNLPGEMIVTVTFKEVSCGTDVHIVQENIPKQIPLEICHLGWQESLMQLAQLVEVNIPDEV